MGLFGNLFKKQECICCGRECGALGRTKLRDGEYVCSDCVRNCSRYVRVSEFTKEMLAEHMAYMKRQEQIYQTCFPGTEHKAYPSAITNQSIVFHDSLGMFEIIDRRNSDNKTYHEIFRYDQVAGYETYVKYGTPKDGKSEKPFEEYGVIITLLSERDASRMSMGTQTGSMAGRQCHPYVKQPITVCFSTKESDYKRADYSINVIQHFNYIFGVNDDQRGLFSFRGSKNEQRQMQAAVDMTKLFAATVKAAAAGADEDSAEGKALKEQFEQTKASTDAHTTRGLSVYTEAADAAERRVPLE